MYAEWEGTGGKDEVRSGARVLGSGLGHGY